MVRIKQRDSKGFYYIDGKPLLSVTKHFDKLFGVPSHVVQYYHCKKSWGILKDIMLDILKDSGNITGWINKQDNPSWETAINMRNDAGTIGTRIHDKLEAYYFKDQYPDDEIAKKVIKIDTELQSKGVEMFKGEQTVWSTKIKAAGTTDVIGFIDGSVPKLVIGDWKSGYRDTYKELMQIGVYGHAVLENQEYYGLPFKFTEDSLIGFVAHTGREKEDKVKVDWYDSNDMAVGLKHFKHVQALLKDQNKI